MLQIGNLTHRIFLTRCPAGASPEDPPATAADGPWVISLDMPSYLPAMQHIKNRDIREKLYRAYITRASSDEQDNIPIIRRILQIKAETSAMLGYKSFAEKSLSTKMAPSELLIWFLLL